MKSDLTLQKIWFYV